MNIIKCLLLIACFANTYFSMAQVCPSTIVETDSILQIEQLPSNFSVPFSTAKMKKFRLENSGLEETVRITLCGDKGGAITAYQVENAVNVGYSIPKSSSCAVLDLKVKSKTNSYFINLADASCKPIGNATVHIHRLAPISTTLQGTIKDASGKLANSWAFKDLDYDLDYTPEQVGVFEFLNLNTGQEIILKPERIAPKPIYENLSVNDILKIIRHILGKDTLQSPFQIVAADVDRNDAITITDVNLLRHVILRRFNTFKEGTSHYSYFVRDSILEAGSTTDILVFGKEALTVQGGKEDTIQADFVEIKLGDLTSWDTSPLIHKRVAKAIPAAVTNDALHFSIESAALQAGELLVNYDADAFQFNPIKSSLSGDYTVYERDGKQYIHWIWLSDIDGDRPSTFYFDKIEDTAALPSIENFYLVSKEGSFETVHLDIQQQKDLELECSNVYPNPGIGTAFIDIQSAQNSTVEVHFFSLDGRLLDSQVANIHAGQQTISFDRKGVAYVQVRLGAITKVIKL